MIKLLVVLLILGVVFTVGCAPVQHTYRRNDSQRMRMQLDHFPDSDHSELEGKI